MKILVIGDLHGRKPIIKTKDFDAIVLIGDVCDDRKISPLFRKFFRLLKHANEQEVSLDFEEFASQYLGTKKKFGEYEKQSLEEGAKIVRYLDSFGKPIFMVAGNWDQSYGPTRIKEKDIEKNDYNYMKYFYDSWLGDKINPRLLRGTKNVKNCMLHLQEFQGINFIGYGLSSGPEKLGGKRKLNITKEQMKKLRKAHKKIVDKLENEYKKRDKKFPIFFITHNIPFKTKLDVITDKESYAYKKHLGSTIARDFCEKHKPLICVGGHIHDKAGIDRIGKTIVINPGYGPHAQVLVEIDEKRNKVKRVKFLR